MKLTTPERQLLELISSRQPINAEQAAGLLGKPLSAVSRIRQRLLAKGLISDWDEFSAPLHITEAGRAALAAQEGER